MQIIKKFWLDDKEEKSMSNSWGQNPDRYDYDRDEFYYDEETDTLTAWDRDESYTGDGEKIDSYSD